MIVNARKKNITSKIKGDQEKREKQKRSNNSSSENQKQATN